MNDTLNAKTFRNTPIAIIGMGAIFPDATGLKRYWQLLRTSHDAIRPVPDTHWKASDYLISDPCVPKGVDHVAATTGGFLDQIDFDPTEFGIPPTILEATDTAQLLSLIAAREALETGGYFGPSAKYFDRSRVSVITGATGAQELTVSLGARLTHPKWRKAMVEAGISPEIAEELAARIAEQFVPWQENSFPGLLGNVIAGRIANRLDLRGTNCATDAACASSLAAIHLALMELETGRCDMALAGGCDTFNDIFMFMCFSKTHALSPSGQIHPFADDADGTILGEGTGMILLKRLDEAQQDGDKIFAIIRGLGSSSDGKNLSIYAPSSQGQQACLKKAYAMAEISPTDVTLVEAHGTGTKVGDATEFEAINTFYSQTFDGPTVQPWCAIGSVKSQIGHGKAAAGIASLIKTALALHHKVLPATIHVAKPHPNMDFENSPFYVNTTTRPWFHTTTKPRRAGVSSFGFGGSNFHAILEESTQRKNVPSWDGSVQLFAFSADTLEDLEFKINDFIGMSQEPSAILQSEWLAQTTRRTFSPAAPFRLLFIQEPTTAQTPSDLASAALNHLQKQSASSWHEGNIYFGKGAPDGKLAILFPGQGSQYLNMGKDLLNLMPDSFEAMNNAGGPIDLPQISQVIYPRPTFDKALHTQFEERLNQTQYTQPALAAFNFAIWQSLQYFEIHPDFAAGHSFGELSALNAAGMISNHDLEVLAVERGRLMAEGDGGQGGMLAVQGTLEAIEQMLLTEKIDLVLANRNSPSQGVLSGHISQIELAQEACVKYGFAFKRLNVSGAFHSPLMQSAYTKFSQTLEQIEMAETPLFPVVSNVTAGLYPPSQEECKKLLSRQLVNPVHFVDLIQNLEQQGVTTFVECGPKTVLTKLTDAILKNKKHLCLAVDSSSGRKSGITDLARILCHLASCGYSVAIDKWEDSVEQPVKQRMTVKLCGANYRDPKNVAPSRGPIKALQSKIVKNTVYAQQESISVSQAYTPNQSPGLSPALSSIQEVQRLASEAHRKYLEAQSQIQQTLQVVLQSHNLSGALPQQTPPVSANINQTEHSASKPQKQPEIQVIRPVQSVVKDAGKIAADVIDAMMTVVSELTGYPKEMLDLDMDMEADLGIDSIKRVEILAAIQKRVPGLPQVSSAILGTLKTLREVADQFKVTVPTTTPNISQLISAEASVTTDVINTMMSVVAELTGYPKEMLDLDMDMEADLGIDSIKRVEILAAIQKQIPGLPQVSSAVLGTLRTLREVADQFKMAVPPTISNTSQSIIAGASVTTDVINTMMSVVAELTGYPKEMLDLDMDMEADLGIDSIKRVEILAAIQKQIPGLPQVSSAMMGTLRTLREVADQFQVQSKTSSAATSSSGPKANTIANVAVQTATSIAQAGALGIGKLTGDLYEVIAHLTGYPSSMLEPNMDMEADLGIDSIKRVEILAALQKRIPGLPQISSAALGGLRTLQEILDYVAGNPQSEKTAKPVTKTPSTPVGALQRDSFLDTLMISVAELTGYPKDMLTPDMDLEADLGIDSIKRVEILADMQKRHAGIGSFNATDMATLHTLGEIADFLSKQAQTEINTYSQETVDSISRKGDAFDAKLPRRVPTLIEIDPPSSALRSITQGTIVVFAQNHTDGNALAEELTSRGMTVKLLVEPILPPQTNVHNISALVIMASSQTSPLPLNSHFLHNAFILMNALGSQLQTAAANSMRSLLATITWQGGNFSFGQIPNTVSCEQGGLAGLSKTAAIEWQEVVCRAIDCSIDVTISQIADELSLDSPCETGLTSDNRVTISLQDKQLSPPVNPFSSGDVLIVTGGARGVTLPCVFEFAKFSGCDLLLLGRSEFNAAEPSWIQGINEEAAIKRAIIHNAFGNEKPTPAMVNQEHKRICANREIAKALSEFQKNGIRAEYHSVDVRNTAELMPILEMVRTSKRKISGIIHAAGVIEDKLITEKSSEQFDRVVQTKVEGLQSLLDATSNDTLKLIALFSSVSARFGNRGQADYSAANEVLNKTAQYLAHMHPTCRVVSLNWGPWEAGMVTPQLKHHFESQGIRLIGLSEGARAFVSEVCQPPDQTSVEVVLGHGFETVITPESQSIKRSQSMSQLFSATVSTEDWHFLNSHKLSERPVLPLAMSIEIMAYVAMAENPGLDYIGADHIRVFKGIGFENETSQFSVYGTPADREGTDSFRMNVETRLSGGKHPGTRCELLLSSGHPHPSGTMICPRVSGAQILGKKQIYNNILFHGSHFQALKAVYDLTDSGLHAWGQASPNPSKWLNTPLRPQWITDPLCIDLALQIGIIWCMTKHNLACLPSSIESIRMFAKPAQDSDILLQFIDAKFDGTLLSGNICIFDAPTGKPLMKLNGVEWTANNSLIKTFGKVQA